MHAIELTLGGPIRVHFETAPADPTTGTIRTLCTDGGGAFSVGMHTWTTDRGKVTCPGCLEWLHA